MGTDRYLGCGFFSGQPKPRMSRGVMESNYCCHGYVNEVGEGSSRNKNATDDVFEGIEDMTLGDEEELPDEEEDMGIEGFGDIKFNTVTPSEVKTMEFDNPEAAHSFYNDYGMANGFSVRRDKKGQNKKEIVWKNFVCSREGYREAKYVNMPNCKREHRTVTRCGCKAEMRIRLDMNSGRWYVSSFHDDHNHQLLAEKFAGMLRSHQKMSDADIA